MKEYDINKEMSLNISGNMNTIENDFMEAWDREQNNIRTGGYVVRAYKNPSSNEPLINQKYIDQEIISNKNDLDVFLNTLSLCDQFLLAESDTWNIIKTGNANDIAGLDIPERYASKHTLSYIAEIYLNNQQTKTVFINSVKMLRNLAVIYPGATVRLLEEECLEPIYENLAETLNGLQIPF